MTVASFIAAVRAGLPATRTEQLDAADALEQAEELRAEVERLTALVEAAGIPASSERAFANQCLADKVDAEIECRRLAERVRTLEGMIRAARDASDRLPPETGWIHAEGKR